ncbi:hypothetical protein DRP98_06135 [candidate division KSB1 bacterium]|nr:MAG: hypothetical protein DRQ00_04515 [candidate division KSB1 bacterium]RKY79990.1 MAG: hypothetical protein DRQ12_02405 [candidate division KSB1 bacterium]RKY83917.1 MAG: hypothetical protein DRP98_06135 [candidate division KSB1 bacterium]RKY89231.1 MAG: hypothetical protein DRQ11_01595 [candidate division KSB1 bacterium]HDI51726.1 DUF370 domain-containing protein [Bacteroidota bacterium]
MLSIGYKNVIAKNRIIAIISPNSRPVKMMIQSARENGKLIDATLGKKTKSVIVTDSDHVILSTNSTETLTQRIGTCN